jgi:ribulose-phosphate 3-epimerase
MDGHFVPNITVGPLVVEALKRETSIFLDVHLMIENPLQYIGVFAKAGADLLTVHWEACPEPRDVIREIKKLGVQAGLAIRPKTSADVLVPLLSDLDLVLVMTVEPGFGGQVFMPEMLEKVRLLRRLIGFDRPRCQIQVDGGIGPKTARLAAEAGATSLVAGNAIFGASDAAVAFKELQRLVDLSSQTQVK